MNNNSKGINTTRSCKLEAVSIVGCESEDVLNSGFEDRSEGGGFLDDSDRTHVSVDHYCQYQTLAQLGLNTEVSK